MNLELTLEGVEIEVSWVGVRKDGTPATWLVVSDIGKPDAVMQYLPKVAIAYDSYRTPPCKAWAWCKQIDILGPGTWEGEEAITSGRRLIVLRRVALEVRGYGNGRTELEGEESARTMMGTVPAKVGVNRGEKKGRRIKRCHYLS